jgi:DNA (cytosine-5)-methyltransferase 1
MADELLTVSQTAVYLQLSEKTVRRLLGSSQLLASRVGNRSWRIKKTDIDEYLSSRTNSAKRNPDRERKYNVIDLFCGAGGLHIGFERAGYNINLCIDNDTLVEKTHRRNFPRIPMLNRDISSVSADEIRKICGNRIDVIIGGPPCQGFSTIGNRVSSDPDKRETSDSRNELVLAYARIVSEIRPKFIVMENVRGILTMKGGAYLDTVISELRRAGYNADFRVLNMADFGIPQIRERVVIIGNCLGLPVEFPKPTHSDDSRDGLPPWNSCWDAIKDLADVRDSPGINHVALKHTPKNIARYKLIPEGGRLPEAQLSSELYRKNFGNTYKRLSRGRPALTMVPGNDAFPIHPILDRSLTVREAARIQTFPDSVIFEGNRRQQGHQVGNAVPPAFSEVLAELIMNQLHSYYKRQPNVRG